MNRFKNKLYQLKGQIELQLTYINTFELVASVVCPETYQTVFPNFWNIQALSPTFFWKIPGDLPEAAVCSLFYCQNTWAVHPKVAGFLKNKFNQGFK